MGTRKNIKYLTLHCSYSSNILLLGTVIEIADNNKSLYTNIRHDLGLQALEYWLEKLQHNLPLLVLKNNFTLLINFYIK